MVTLGPPEVRPGRIPISQAWKSQSMAQSDAIAATSDAPNGPLPRPRAVLFIVFLGIVSLFGDMTYEVRGTSGRPTTVSRRQRCRRRRLFRASRVRRR